MLYPRMRAQHTEQDLIELFGGYDHRLRSGEGSWYDTKNLSSDHAPLLSTRRRRADTHRRAVALLENDRVKGNVTREALEKEYEEEALNVIHAARAGEVDDVVEDAALRQRLISAVLMLSGKAASLPKRRHVNMPL